MTEAEAYAQVMTAVIEDRDRSIESAIARGIRAGITLERERIRTIIGLPTPEGLERAAIALAVTGTCSVDAVREFIEMHTAPPMPVTDVEARARRAAFKVIENENKGKDHALEN